MTHSTSEDKKEKARTLEDVHKEYSSGCTKAGHLQYQIATLTEELYALNETLKTLNQEAFALNEKTTKVDLPKPKSE